MEISNGRHSAATAARVLGNREQNAANTGTCKCEWYGQVRCGQPAPVKEQPTGDGRWVGCMKATGITAPQRQNVPHLSPARARKEEGWGMVYVMHTSNRNARNGHMKARRNNQCTTGCYSLNVAKVIGEGRPVCVWQRSKAKRHAPPPAACWERRSCVPRPAPSAAPVLRRPPAAARRVKEAVCTLPQDSVRTPIRHAPPRARHRR